MNNYTNKEIKELYKAILSLSTITEAEQFFRDLMTIQEINAVSERWQIVQLLGQGLSYREIAKKLNTSTTTVGRVATWLKDGMGGYKLVLNKLVKKHHNTSSDRKGVLFFI